MAEEICPGCGHSIGRHVKCEDSRVRCFCIESGTTIGIIMNYVQMCDCVEFRSESRERREVEEKKRNEEWRREMDERLNEIAKVIRT